MCGIIGYNGKQDPKGILLDGLKRLEYRGYDSAGIAVFQGKQVSVFRSEGRLKNLEKKLKDTHFDGAIGIGHTRWATHGAPTEINAHPHRVGAITLVHNGIIENFMEHKEALTKLGRTFTSDTDSEIVAHLFDEAVEDGKSIMQAVVEILPKLRGSYAFVMMSDREPDRIIGIRNGAPLLVGVSDHENFLASDVQAILSRTNRIIYLNDGEFAVCEKEKVSLYDLKGKPIQREAKTILWSAEQAEKSGYRHYMLKEIFEQPQAIANTIENNVDHGNGIVSISELSDFTATLKKTGHISLVACGTARHAALVGKYYLEQFAKIPVDVDFGSEFRYRNPILEKDSLVVLISQSGETADTLAALREAKRKGIPTLAICNVRESTLAREASKVLYTNAGPEIGVASTKAFTTQLTMLYMFALELGNLRGELSTEAAQEFTHDLLTLPILVDKTLQISKQVEKIAENLEPLDFFFYIARDINYPIALEGALKLKEISYAHAEGYPAGELKHGPIALIDRKTAIITLAPHLTKNKTDFFKHIDETTIYDKILSNLHEVKARGGVILSLGSEDDKALEKESKYFLPIPKASWALNPILYTIPLQLLAYHIALLKGTDVDKPRNLAKSVTVE